VITADHPNGHVGPVAVKLVGVFQIRGISGAVLVGQHENHGTGDVAHDLSLLVERHQRMEGQLQALIAGERVRVAVSPGQPSAG